MEGQRQSRVGNKVAGWRVSASENNLAKSEINSPVNTLQDRVPVEQVSPLREWEGPGRYLQQGGNEQR